MRLKTSQELFWAGEFGNAYLERNNVAPEHWHPFFAQVLSRTYGVRTICELGANRGHNLSAIAGLSPNYELFGVDVNARAVAEMRNVPGVTATLSSAQDYEPGRTFDLVFTSGVLIHICPEDLPTIYKKLYILSNRYIMINEYFSPTPVTVEYRGTKDALFKRDFAGELIDTNGGKLAVVDYGFLWKRAVP